MAPAAGTRSRRPRCARASRASSRNTPANRSAGEVLPALLSLARARNTTVVIVTHDLALSRAADRVLELREGRLHERREPAVSAPR